MSLRSRLKARRFTAGLLWFSWSLAAGFLLNCSGSEEAMEPGETGGTESGGRGSGGRVGSSGGSGSGGDGVTVTGGASLGGMGGDATGGDSSSPTGGDASGGMGWGGEPEPLECTPATGEPGSGLTLDYKAVRHFPLGGNYSGVEVHFGDLNEDGQLEAISALTQGGRIAILSGTGNATLSAAVDHVIPDVSQVEVFDANGDTHLDLVFSAYPDIAVQLGDGQGKFGATKKLFTRELRGLPRPVELVGSAHQDLLLQHGTRLELWEGNGSGSYTFHSSADYLRTISHFDVADVNGDTYPDLVTSGGSSINSHIGVAFGTGRDFGSFVSYRTYDLFGVALSAMNQLLLGDINEDGKTDIVIEDDRGLNVFWGDASGTLRQGPRIEPGGFLETTALFDADQDGHLDFLISSSNRGAIEIHYGIGNGSFEVPQLFSTASTAFRIYQSDLDQDGVSDIVMSGSTLEVMRGEGNRRFNARAVVAKVLAPLAVELAYMNQDVHLDLVYIHQTSVSVALGKGDGSFDAAQTIDTGNTLLQLALLQADADQSRDVAVVNQQQELLLLRGNGVGGLSQPEVLGPARLVAVGDFNEDEVDDIISSGWKDVVLRINDGTGVFNDSPIASGTAIYDIEAVDVDQDGHLDLFIADNSGNLTWFYRGDGRGEFSLEKTNTELRPLSTMTDDYNGDCRLETLLSWDDSRQRIFSATDSEFVPFDLSNFSGKNLVSDMDQDGYRDIVALIEGYAYCYTHLYQAEATYDRHFMGCVNVVAGAVGDLNHDGLDDLVIAHKNPGLLSVALNRSY